MGEVGRAHQSEEAGSNPRGARQTLDADEHLSVGGPRLWRAVRSSRRAFLGTLATVAIASGTVGGLIGSNMASTKVVSGTSGLGAYDKGRVDGRSIVYNHRNRGDVSVAPASFACQTAAQGIGFIRFFSDSEMEEYIRGCSETYEAAAEN
jgi:hypothetical protein